MLADVFALYLKTKNFHRHMSGRQFRDYHSLLDEYHDQIFGRTQVSGNVRARSVRAPFASSATSAV
jgi:starvation-inducible DNA-binding protein